MAKMIIEVGYLIALTLMSAPVLLMLALALATGKLTWLLVKDTKVALPLLCSAYRFVLQDKAVGGFSANFNLLSETFA
jgi:hypothetical protein